MDRQTIASYNRSWSVVGSRHGAKNRARKIRLGSAGDKSGERIPPKGGDKTKIHELIVEEHLSKQWGNLNLCHRGGR
jgi:hypothetical protein